MQCIGAGRIVLKQTCFASRLVTLHENITEVIAQYKPDFAAIEDVFVNKNVNSALKLGHARGVLMLACAKHGLVPSEITARQVKLNITGSGGADKAQVATMVRHVLGLGETLSSDASDALSIAISCGHMLYKTQRMGV